MVFQSKRNDGLKVMKYIYSKTYVSRSFALGNFLIQCSRERGMPWCLSSVNVPDWNAKALNFELLDSQEAAGTPEHFVKLRKVYCDRCERRYTRRVCGR